MQASTRTTRFLYIAALVIAGEMVFSLPFHIPRLFRPTMLEVFDLTNTQLGDLFAVYGVVGHLNLFKFLAAIALTGLAVVIWLAWLKRNNLRREPVPLQ